jgi:hypothetical protein
VNRIVVSICLIAASFASAQGPDDRWLRKSGYGLMFHYEAFKNHPSKQYNAVIDSFDVSKWADSIERAGAGHVIFVIGQHWGKYCAPNSVYEQLIGVENGVWTSKRDLIMEIGQALKARDIKLILYMTARAPMRHYSIIAAMGDTLPMINGKPAGPKVNTMSHPRTVPGFVRSEHQEPTPTFLKNWGDVCGEWSMRYGDLVGGWWFDGYKTAMKDAYPKLKAETYNIDTWVEAVRSGNPRAELAFNAGAYPGASLCTDGRLCPHQTFSAGEGHGFIQKGRKGAPDRILSPENFPAPEGVIWHFLFPLSDGWGAGTVPKEAYTAEYLINGIDRTNAQGGVVTLDIPCQGDGTIPPAILDRLGALAAVKDTLTDGKRSYSDPTHKTVRTTTKVVSAKTRTTDGKTIGQWTPATIEADWSDVQFDVTGHINRAGVYAISFVYAKGRQALEIKSVAVYRGDQKLSEDNHEGFSGGFLRDVVYTLTVPTHDKQARYLVKATVKGSGGTDSYGTLNLDRHD